MACTYVVENCVNGKLYIGCTGSSFAVRWRQHKSSELSGRPTYFVRAIRKYGFQSFSPIAIFPCQTIEESKTMERFLISLFNTQDRNYGYNLNAGGDGITNASPEVRQKIAAANSRRIVTEQSKKKISEANSGNANWLGKKHSDETKRKMALAALGNTRAKGWKPSEPDLLSRRQRMLGNSFTRGISLTEDHKHKIAVAHLRIGDKTSARMKGNNLRLGIKHSEETKQRMREGHARRKALHAQK